MRKNEVIFLLLLLGFLFFYLFGGNIFGYVYYPFDSFNYARNYNVEGLVNIYNNYSEWFDFAIFLIIFLSLSKVVFGERFKESQWMYIGIGLFLAFALVLWENRSGFSLLNLFGPFVVALVFLLIIFIFFNFLRHTGLGLMMSISIGYFIIYIFLWFMGDKLGIFDLLRYRFNFDLEALLKVLTIPAAIILIGSIIALFFRRRER